MDAAYERLWQAIVLHAKAAEAAVAAAPESTATDEGALSRQELSWLEVLRWQLVHGDFADDTAAGASPEDIARESWWHAWERGHR